MVLDLHFLNWARRESALLAQEWLPGGILERDLLERQHQQAGAPVTVVIESW
jgi:hypothetical protein